MSIKPKRKRATTQKFEICNTPTAHPSYSLEHDLYHTSHYYQIESTAQPKHLIGSNEAIYNSINSQKNIGWNPFLRGRITKIFQPVVRSYFRRYKLSAKFSGRYWSKHIIKALLTLHHEKWQIYCSIIHEPVPHTKNSAPAR